MYFNNNVPDSSYYYYLKAEKLFLKKEKTDVLGNLYLNKSTIQLIYVDFSGAEYSATQALKFSRLNNDKLGEYDALTNIGIASFNTENYKKSIEYHLQALEIANENNLNPSYFLQEISLNNIGNCYLYLKDYKNAIIEFKKALKNVNLAKEKPGLYAILLDNLAYSKFKLGDYENTLDYFLKSLRIRDSLNADSRIVYSKIHLSEYYYGVKDTVKALKYAEEALSISKKTNLSSDLLGSLKQISLVDHKNSSQYSKEYIKISDSIQLEERKSKDKFARIAFETDEIIQEKDKLAEQNRSLLYFFVGTLFVGLLLFVIRTQRAKNRELMLKQQQQKANEEIYSLMISQQATIEENRVREKKRIAQELHDGVLGRLFGARLNLDSLNRSTDEESINSRFNYLNELKNIEQDIREISHDLNREKHALINNFVAIVQNLLEEQSSSFEPELTSSIDEKIQWDTLGNNTKINLYRILQESLQNINKYAQAKHIHVEFKTDGDNITLRVIDDGVGFEVDTKKRGIGLQNMLSRTSESEGTFEVQSQKGKGTTITVSVPLVKTQVEA
ncbi:sensor histidine kinase [Flavobacterium sp. CYK-55]|uniref:tetratricopeptide repeat-containing sensor histidine kinase n=1 Tax=Flavobacterium sp. CYK-55 TaxID=2835529 RepID=UPI001BCCE20A|nr:sensor histidine kinase [Flavobacterium sp. CYK-55]MBS7786022.1 sensor histidine kinase [Flavobacterium sp. CYK-55]